MTPLGLPVVPDVYIIDVTASKSNSATGSMSVVTGLAKTSVKDTC